MGLRTFRFYGIIRFNDACAIASRAEVMV